MPRHLWLLLLPLVVVVYSSSFNAFPIIAQQHSVLGDADSANYIRLIQDFKLTHVYGDPYTRPGEGRSVGDNAQKHKLHHILYVALAALLYQALALLLSPFGLPPDRAIYAVNALITCVNLLLIHTLLRQFNPRDNPRWPFLLLYVSALSTWIFGSIPESWPLTGTLVLLFLIVHFRKTWSVPALAALIGLGMLNNLILVFLLVLPGLTLLRESSSVWTAARRFLVTGLITIGTWLTLLTVLSLFDPLFRPDHYAHYTLWYKDFTNPDLTIFNLYVWKSVLSGLFVTSVVSNQADPFVPQEAVLHTLQTSRIGAVAIGAYLALVAGCVWRAALELRHRLREASNGPRSVLDEKAVHVLAFCGAMILMTIFLYYPGGFLYSTTVVPLIALLLCRFIDLGRPLQATWFYGTLGLIIVNNTLQVIRFRDVLAALG